MADKNAPSGTRQSSLDLHDPTSLTSLGEIDLVAQRVVEGLMSGRHQSPFKGSSVEFVEHRVYTPGDEIRHIDWRAVGKTGKYYVKEYEEETNVDCQLLIDVSGSMNFGQSTITKHDYACFIAATLAYLFLHQRDSVGCFLFDDQVRNQLPPSSSTKHFQQITTTLKQSTPGGETQLSNVLGTILSNIRRRSFVIILSDCFDDLEQLLAVFRAYQNKKHEIVLFHIVSPEEETFPFRNSAIFEDLEAKQHRQFVDPYQMRSHYLREYQNFCSTLESFCRQTGIDFQHVTTDTPYQRAVQSFLTSRKNH